MALNNFALKASRAVPLEVVRAGDYSAWFDEQTKEVQTWLKNTDFGGHAGRHALIPGSAGALKKVVAVMSNGTDLWDYARLPRALPARSFRLSPEPDTRAAEMAALGWAMGSYSFTRYKKAEQSLATLVWPRFGDRSRTTLLAEGIFLCRDLINTPASDMGPEELAFAAKTLAEQHGAKFSSIVGSQLLRRNYPAVHAVGRASERAPRLVDLKWGNPKHPKLTLVGKGVCFDSGGLDLKPAANMLLMKKDMGGAAAVLGLAHAIMGQKFPVRLRVLIAAVENSISGNAFRPLDVLETRKGLKVEVGNTDAEGRLVLADTLAEADSERPDLIIDVATLTGAARVALGTKLPALFCNSDKLAAQIVAAGEHCSDPLWRLPLHAPYKKLLNSNIADLNNISSGPYGGAITAALFLQHFVSKATRWVHIDTMAYNQHAAAGRPVGGEALGLRALEAALTERYVKPKAHSKRAHSKRKRSKGA